MGFGMQEREITMSLWAAVQARCKSYDGGKLAELHGL